MLLLSVPSSVLCEAAGVGRKTPGSSVGVVQPRPDVCPAPAGGLPCARHSCSVGPRTVGHRGHPLSLRGGFQVSSVVVGHSSSLPSARPSAASDVPTGVIQSHDCFLLHSLCSCLAFPWLSYNYPFVFLNSSSLRSWQWRSRWPSCGRSPCPPVEAWVEKVCVCRGVAKPCKEGNLAIRNDADGAGGCYSG